MNKPNLRVFSTIAFTVVLGFGYVFFGSSNNQSINSESDFSESSFSSAQPRQSEQANQSTNIDISKQTNIPSPATELVDSSRTIDPLIESLNSNFNDYKFSSEEIDAITEGLVRRYGEFIYSLDLNSEDEASVVNLILNILKKEHYFSMLVQDEEISHEEFRRLSTTNEDIGIALSYFLTPDEMKQFSEFMDQSETRFLERFRDIQIMMITSGSPNLTDVNRNHIVGIFIEELARLRSGVGGVLSNDDVHASYLRTKSRISGDDSLNSEQFQLANEYLDSQIKNFK